MSHARHVVFVLVLAVAVLALPAPAFADVPSSVVRNASTSCLNPDVSGDLVVWEDMAGNQDIWARNLTGGVAFPIVQLSSSTQQTPAVDGTTVVWADDRASGGVYKIYGYDLLTATEFPVSTTAGVKSDPDVSGRYVVWVNRTGTGSNPLYDVWGYDLETETEFPICTNSAKQLAPAVSGDLVVWEDYRNNATYADIYAARIDPASHTVGEFTVCAQPIVPVHGDWTPAVYGDTVVWADSRGGGNSRVFAARVSGTSVVSESEWEVSQTPTRSTSNPSINGVLIAWRYSGGTTYDDIYARWIGGTSEFPLASTSQYEKTVSVGATATVWGNGTTWDIYGSGIGGAGWYADITVNSGAPYTNAREVTLALSAFSAAGTASEMCFSSDSTNWTAWEPYATSRSYQLPAGDGPKTVYVSFKDADGHLSPAKGDGIVLDQNSPVTGDDAPESVAHKDVTVTLTSDDGGGMGVSAIYYKVDDLDFTQYLGPFVVSGDGPHTIQYFAFDNANHIEDIRTTSFSIDGPPTTTDNAGDGWHGSGFVLHLEAYDPAGVERTEYSIEGGPWQAGTDKVFVVSGKKLGGVKEFMVQYRSVDLSGNVEEPKTCTVRIDARRPVTTDDYSGLPQATDVWLNLISEDPHSGVAETWYAVDGADPMSGTWVYVPAPADGSNDGPHTIVYYSIDGAGNVEAPRTVTVTIAAGGGAAPLRTLGAAPQRGLRVTSVRFAPVKARLARRSR